MPSILVCVVALLSTSLAAEVTSLGPGGFAVKHDVPIKAAPGIVYDTLTVKVGSWWNPEHTYSHDAKNLSIAAVPGGCFCERFPDSGGVQHMTVVFASPGKALRMTGALGPLQGSGLAGSMTWELAKSETGTKLERLKAFLETGSPASK